MPAQLPLTTSPYLEPYQAKQYRKHLRSSADTDFKHLDNDAKLILELHEFYTRPAKKGYCIIDDLLTYAYHPETIGDTLTDIGECDFYNMPSKKGYVLGYNGILYTARLDRMNGEGIVDRMSKDSDKGGIPKGFKGYFLTANVNQHKIIENIWRKVAGNHS